MAAYLSAIRLLTSNTTSPPLVILSWPCFYSLLHNGLSLATLLITGIIHFIDGDELSSQGKDTKVSLSFAANR